MTERKEVKVTVKDKRRTGSDSGAAAGDPRPQAPNRSESPTDEGASSPVVQEPEHDYLVDLQRLQAEFENYRKRMMKDQAEVSVRAKARLVEGLLPVLDNFERAIAHGEGGEGVALVFKDLKENLATEGLQEVPGEGAPFDPNVHEAVESREDPNVDDIVVKEVYRRGYWFGDQLLRAAMVVVGRPLEKENN